MKTIDLPQRSPLLITKGNRFTPLMQSEFDDVMYHHGFEKQARGSNSPHVKYTHFRTGKVVTVKPRRVFSSDNLDRISKDVSKVVGHLHFRCPANWNPKLLRGVTRGDLVALREDKDEQELSPETQARREAKRAEAEEHAQFAERMRKLASINGGENLPRGISQIQALRLAASAFKKAKKARAALASLCDDEAS